MAVEHRQPSTAVAEPSTSLAESSPQRTEDDALPLLSKLNARGFRLVQIADLVGLWVVLLGIFLIRHGWTWPTYPRELYLLSFAVTIAIFLAALYFGGMYEREPRLGRPSSLPPALRLTIGAAGLVALLILVASGIARELGSANARALPFPIANLLLFTLFGAMAVAANRWLAMRVRTRNVGPPRVLLVGTSDELDLARQHLRETDEDVTLLGAVSDVDGLIPAVDRERVTDVVLLSGRWIEDLYPDVLHRLDLRGVSVLQRVGPTETLFGLARIHQVGGMPFVLLRHQTLPSSRRNFKRFVDLLLLLLLAPLALPVLLLVGLYVALVAGRPVLFWQDRVGAGGHTFRMVKFRTMATDAEEDGRPRLATTVDPRVVPACAWLRATRLDELPQVWNILRGEMSLVGPRPERPELIAEFEPTIPGYARRHELPPGLTGLAQIHGRYHTDAAYKLGYDLQYLVNWSPILDVQILLRTAWVVLTRRV